ncbi:unnamed protein product [Protopolystoma xenopodis]|uniref:Uncharacterized protein n=1 Tax=Protopolystoma xenopodis TaxID=117903 RepID=A0A3S4ZE67_9PLAT|nr:unnamed protein product [Protopolystoma xenopodis]
MAGQKLIRKRCCQKQSCNYLPLARHQSVQLYAFLSLVVASWRPRSSYGNFQHQCRLCAFPGFIPTRPDTMTKLGKRGHACFVCRSANTSDDQGSARLNKHTRLEHQKTEPLLASEHRQTGLEPFDVVLQCP